MTDRLRWPDVAKGACIVLVVLWHVTRKDYLALPWQVGVPVTGAWGSLSEVLLPVRMPLFFCISGLFAASRLSGSWRDVASGRAAPLLYLFVLWTSVHTVLFRLTPGFDTAIADSPLALLTQLTVTPGNLWYLLALATYVVVARATVAAPHATLVAAAVLSGVAYAGLVPTPGNRAGLLTNLVWFLLGVRLASRRDALPVPTGSAAVVVVAAFVAAAGAWQVLDADRWPGVRLVLGALGIAAGAAVALAVSRSRVAEPLARLGRLTLPVYVLHLPLVALVHVGSEHLVDGAVARSLPLVIAYPAVVTVLVVATCLALHRLAELVGAGWLFTAPWTRRPELRPARARARRPRSAPGPADPACAGSRPRGS